MQPSIKEMARFPETIIKPTLPLANEKLSMFQNYQHNASFTA
jgi:hypothetical protein